MRVVKLLGYLLIFILISACTKEKNLPLQGYIEGEYINLASSEAGTLQKIYIDRGEQVKAGQLLFILDTQLEHTQLQQAQQQLAQAVTTAQLSKDNLNRLTPLYRQHAIDQASYVQAKLNYERDLKFIDQLKANINEAKWRVSQKRIYAPISGSIYDTFYRTGEFVAAQSPVVSMLAPENIKLIFYIPEPLRSQIIIGHTVQFNCDGCTKKYGAKINFISPQAEYTPSVIYSRESRQKLVFRVEANLIDNSNRQFYPGMPVDVFIANPEKQ